MTARIIELTRAHIVAEIGDMTVRVEGEAYLPGYGSPDFVLYKNSMIVLEGPLAAPLEEMMRNRILAVILECLKERGMTAEIE